MMILRCILILRCIQKVELTWVDGGDDEEDGSEISSLGGSGAFNGNKEYRKSRLGVREKTMTLVFQFEVLQGYPEPILQIHCLKYRFKI